MHACMYVCMYACTYENVGLLCTAVCACILLLPGMDKGAVFLGHLTGQCLPTVAGGAVGVDQVTS